MSRPLRDALQSAYAAFSDVPCPIRVERHGEAILELLTTMPLRQLPPHVIGPYAGWAITTAGSERDYMYFLPRILELAVVDQTRMGTEPAVIAWKVKRAGWQNWGTEQQRAVQWVFEQAFLSYLRERYYAEVWLSGLACLGQSVEGLLDAWEQSSSSNAMLQLAEFVAQMEFDEGKITGPYWRDAETAQRHSIGIWGRSEAVRRRLTVALQEVPQSEGPQIEEALGKLGGPSR